MKKTLIAIALLVIATSTFLLGIAWRDFESEAKVNPLFLNIGKPQEIQRIELKSVDSHGETMTLFNLRNNRVLNLPGDSRAINSLWMVSVQKKDGVIIGPVSIEARYGRPSEIEVGDSVRTIGELPMWRFLFLKLKHR